LRFGLLEWMNRRQRQILVHSFLYYQLNENIISDSDFDRWSKELYEAMKENPDVAKRSVYYKDFLEFDGSSGYDLQYANTEVKHSGYRLLKIHAEKRKKK